jgi:CHAD domain-containing protein
VWWIRLICQDTLHLVAELKQLQDCLGDLQDTAQTNQLFQKLAHDVEMARESACLAGWQARRGYDAMLWFGILRKNFNNSLKRWLKERKDK